MIWLLAPFAGFIALQLALTAACLFAAGWEHLVQAVGDRIPWGDLGR